MPVIDALAQEYAGKVDVIAIAWASTHDKTAAAAGGLLPSGATRWTLDEDNSVFAAFAVNSQPVAILATAGVEVNRWFGNIGEEELRQGLQAVTA